jgi:hypothetical protein
MRKKLIISSIILLIFLPLVPNVHASWALKYVTTPNTIIATDPPLAADTDNDGSLDSLFIAGKKYGTEDTGIVLRIRSSDGYEMWRQEYIDSDSANQLNPIELYDITGDGCPDVFTHFGAPDVEYEVGLICINGATGIPIWYQLGDYKPAWHHFVIIADKVTNIPYIYFNDHTSAMRKINAFNGTLVKTVPSGLSCDGGLSAADINYDGTVEIILGLHDPPGFQVFNTNLDKLWDAGVDTNSSSQCTALVDVCGDKTLDLISLFQSSPDSEHAGLNVIDGGTHQRNDIMSSYDLGLNAHSQGSIADYDSDGNYEITSGYTGYGHLVKIRRDNTPQIVTTLWAIGTGNGPARFQDLVGDNRFELVATEIVIDTINFQPISGLEPDQWNGYMNDIDNDGLCELFGCRNGQITIYDTDKTPVMGINTYTSDYGYRRLNSEILYEECPGTWWYSWDEWEAYHHGDPLLCDAGGPYSGQAGQSIQFTGTSTGGIPPYNYLWNFGDDSTSNEQNTNHLYRHVGTYNITLTVIDDVGNIENDTATASISSDPPLVSIKKPESAVYFANLKLFRFDFPLVFGKIKVEVNITQPFLSIERVEFYKSGYLQMTDTTPPYSWIWSEHIPLRKVHKFEITVFAYTSETCGYDSIEITKFF